MARPIVFFGEGKADGKFLEDFIKHHFNIDKITYIDIRGKDSIHLSKKFFMQNTDQNGINLLLFDADSDYQAALENVNKQKTESGIEFDTFLFPNNSDTGAVENLLLELTVPEHQGIFECFEPFNTCLLTHNQNYVVPDLKIKIYSYVAFQNLNSKEHERNYLLDCWNLDAPYAQPLVDFLKQYIT